MHVTGVSSAHARPCMATIQCYAGRWLCPSASPLLTTTSHAHPLFKPHVQMQKHLHTHRLVQPRLDALEASCPLGQPSAHCHLTYSPTIQATTFKCKATVSNERASAHSPPCMATTRCLGGQLPARPALCSLPSHTRLRQGPGGGLSICCGQRPWRLQGCAQPARAQFGVCVCVCPHNHDWEREVPERIAFGQHVIPFRDRRGIYLQT
eukprot:1156252-Pelagomonas_calceolata.AAC.2